MGNHITLSLELQMHGHTQICCKMHGHPQLYGINAWSIMHINAKPIHCLREQMHAKCDASSFYFYVCSYIVNYFATIYNLLTMHNCDNVVAFDNADCAFTFKPAIDHADLQTRVLFAMPLYSVLHWLNCRVEENMPIILVKNSINFYPNFIKQSTMLYYQISHIIIG